MSLLPAKEEIHARVIFAQVQKVYRITSDSAVPYLDRTRPERE